MNTIIANVPNWSFFLALGGFVLAITGFVGGFGAGYFFFVGTKLETEAVKSGMVVGCIGAVIFLTGLVFSLFFKFD